MSSNESNKCSTKKGRSESRVEPILRIIDINSKEYWSEDELAAYIGYDVETIRISRRAGQLPFYKFKNKFLYNRKEILALIKTNRQRTIDELQ